MRIRNLSHSTTCGIYEIYKKIGCGKKVFKHFPERRESLENLVLRKEIRT